VTEPIEPRCSTCNAPLRPDENGNMVCLADEEQFIQDDPIPCAEYITRYGKTSVMRYYDGNSGPGE
jgi:hypothetical protein